MKRLITLIVLMFAAHTYADNVDGVELALEKNINGVILHSGKVDSMRTYHGIISKVINANLQKTFAAVANFEEKCNNEFKSKRKFHDKNADCKYHNHNLIESVVEKKIKYTGPKEPNEVDRFVIARYIYNRGAHAQNDLMVVLNYKNDKKQDVIHIKQFMLTDEESKQYLDNPLKRDTAFNVARGNFIMTKLDDTKTNFEYEYIGKTDHWLLNKEMTVNEAYENIAKGINFLVESVEKEVATK